MSKKTPKKSTRPTSRKASSDAMDLKILHELEEALKKTGIEFTYDPALPGRGGLCILNDVRMIILNRRLSTTERLDAILREVPRLDLSGVFLTPIVRGLVEAAGGVITDTESGASATCATSDEAATDRVVEDDAAGSGDDSEEDALEDEPEDDPSTHLAATA